MPSKNIPQPLWKTSPELVGLQLELQPTQDSTLPSNYTYWLHAWFLDQIRQIDPELSAELHDNQTDKAFTLSGFLGDSKSIDRTIQFFARNTYHCQITALNKPLCNALKNWRIPEIIKLRDSTFRVIQWQISLPPTTYTALWNKANANDELSLNFLSPTAFHKNGNHMPLPIPENLFHSYLRRWNSFARRQFDLDEFLPWVREGIVLLRHNIRSTKAQPGKQGSVTGFTGTIQLGLTNKALRDPLHSQLAHTLIAAAPYFGTGHKVTFGLGQTRSGWISPTAIVIPEIKPPAQPQPIVQPATSAPPSITKSDTKSGAKSVPRKIAARIKELQPIFLASKKRQGGDRALKTSLLWATIIARQEHGDSLKAIAQDLELPYDSVKKYSQLARQHLDQLEPLEP
jgi:CRISPR-associated endoribonuclease Cas6